MRVDDQVRAALAGNSNVTSFEPDAYYFAQQLPNDPDFPTLTGLNNVGQFGSTVDADIDAPEAWDETTGSTNVVVGVIDSGIDVTHPDLYLNVWINQGEIPVALRSQLVDTDADDRITFYDLNAAANSAFVRDSNANTYIDAIDLLTDPSWADGVDTDRNAFVDDFFGWNFRTASDEPFAPNDPRDALGHGTHVAGTIGAIGNNGRGVTGINWRSSLMALKFLDNSNSGQTSDAVAAVNYATMMRVDQHENVRVLNASWGQSGSESPALRTAIEAAGAAEILLVAAAGNGNILGHGINLDREPFYPASFDLDNIITVAASGSNDELAQFSNFGSTTVDLAAPGIGVLSTLPGGRYGTANGTSMAAPHVAGTAALIWSVLPSASVPEVRQALLENVKALPGLAGATMTGGRLNAKKAIDSNVFAPRATLLNAPNITVSGGIETLVTVKFYDRQGIDDLTIGDGDLIATRQWGPRDAISLTLVPGSVSVAGGGNEVTATYRLAAPGDTWDVLDFGRYVLSAGQRQVTNRNGQFVPTDAFGEFTVRIADPAIYYVGSLADAVDANVGDQICADASGSCTLRAAIQEANAAVGPAGVDAFGYAAKAVPFAFDDIAATGTRILAGVDDEAIELTDAALGDFHFNFYGTDYLNAFVSSNGLLTFGSGSTAYSNGDLSTSPSTKAIAVLWDDLVTSGVGAEAVYWEVRGNGANEQLIVQWNNANYFGESGLITFQAVLSESSGRMQFNYLDLAGGNASLDEGASATAGIKDTGAQGGNRLLVSRNASSNQLIGTGRSVAIGLVADIAPRTIILEAGTHTIDTPPVSDPSSTFPFPDSRTGCTSVPNLTGWSNAATGDFDATGAITILGDSSSSTKIDAQQLDRVFRVHPGGSLTLKNVTVTGGNSAADQGGGGILSAGTLTVDHVQVSGNSALGKTEGIGGGGIAVWAGAATLVDTTLAENSAYAGGGLFTCNGATSNISRSTLNDNQATRGGGVASVHGGNITVTNSTFSANSGGAVDASSGWNLRGEYKGSFVNSISSDGGFVGFSSPADNLVVGDRNPTSDVFVYNRTTGVTERVSVSSAGVSGNANSADASLSADGRFVAFTSGAFNLVPNDNNGLGETLDVFVRDRLTGTTERVSVASNGNEGNGNSVTPAISGNGRYVAFASNSSTFAAVDTNGVTDIYVFDRVTRTIEIVSVSDAGVPGNSASVAPSISSDGRYVAFASDATNLVASDTNGTRDVFVFDRVLRTSRRANVSQAGAQGLGLSEGARISGDGSTVVFHSYSNVLVPSDTNGNYDVFAKSLIDGSVSLISVASNGTQGNNVSTWPSVSSDGRFVSFTSLAGNLVSGDTNNDWDIFVRDRIAQTTVRVSVAGDGTQGNGTSFDSQINGAGDAIAFSSLATSFLHSQFQELTSTNNVFVKDMASASLASVNLPWVAAPITLSHVTAAFNDGIATIAGRVFFENSLFAGNDVFYDAGEGATSLGYNVIASSARSLLATDVIDANASQSLSPLQDIDGDTQGHLILQGSSAVDHANPSNYLPFDQRGVRREIVGGKLPDSGAVEATTASIAGVAYWDLNRNAVHDSNEPGLDGITVVDKRVASGIQATTVTRADDPRTAAFVESGQFDFPFIEPGDHSLTLVPPTNWQLTARAVDRVTAQTSGPNNETYDQAISQSGRFVAFVTTANNLTAVSAAIGVYVFDRDTHRIELVSVTNDGTPANNSNFGPSISGDGRFVAFTAFSNNLVIGDTNNQDDIFVFDRSTKTVERVSVDSNGAQANAASFRPSISQDGRFVTFESIATNLVAGDSNGVSDIFVFDRVTRQTEMISVATTGAQGNGVSETPTISADGRFVAYSSWASNLVPGDTNSHHDNFVYDRQLRTTERVSVSSLGAEANRQ